MGCGADCEGVCASINAEGPSVTNHVLEEAVESGLLARNPARGLKLPKVEKNEMRFLDLGEVDQLVEAIPERWRPLVVTAAYSGLRFGELAGLRVGDLDLPRGRVTVCRTAAEVRGDVIIGLPKTEAARRTVSLPGFLVPILAEHVGKNPDRDAFVFAAAEGGALRRTNFRRRVWRPAVWASVGEPMRFHDLRHTHAALLIAAGEHPKVIQGRLGHASISTTLDTYGHLFDGLDEAAADRLNEVWEAAQRDALASSTRPGTSGHVIRMASGNAKGLLR